MTANTLVDFNMKVQNINLDRVLEDAKKVLEGNWTGNFTIPAATLYPHQWSWDAAFIAIGNSISILTDQ